MLSVTPAKFEMKGGTYIKKNSRRKGKGKTNVIKQEQKAFDWGGFDDMQKAKDVTVILKHMFSLAEMEQNPERYVQELEEDILMECKTRCGDVRKIRIYQHNPQGVVSVCFKFPQAAAKCVSLMDGRWFGGKQIQADLYDGHTNYNVKKKKCKIFHASHFFCEE